MLFSIIVPVYNAENTLYDCLKSILNQSYTSFEVLVIDNGSTDKSNQIAKEFLSIDNRVKLLKNQKKGVSATRNLGLDYARGTYICFVDSDDLLQENYLSTFHKSLGQQTDLVVCDFLISEKGKVLPNEYSVPYGVYQQNEYLNLILQRPHEFYFGVVWNKCFRRCMIHDRMLKFDDEMNLAEDLNFVLKYLDSVNQVCVVAEKNYIYQRLSSDSLSNSCHNHLVLFDNYKKNYNIFLALCNDVASIELVNSYLFSGLITCVTNYIQDGRVNVFEANEAIKTLYKKLCKCGISKISYKSRYHEFLHYLLKHNYFNLMFCVIKVKILYIKIRR